MIPGFSAGATYYSKPIADLTRDDLVRALAYKTHELQQCYLVMTAAQARDVAARMVDCQVILSTDTHKEPS